MPSSIESFDEAATLETTTLRSLLESDRPEQRVWAIWALALREKGDVAELIQRSVVEQHPGVRRTLAVVLAGHGDVDLLVRLARHNPEVAIRESAMQLVTRLAAGKAIDRRVVTDAAQRDPSVQKAILASVDAGAPEFLVELSAWLLDKGSPDVQLEAFEALLRVDTESSRARATEWLGASYEELAVEVCRRWLLMADLECIVTAAARLPGRIRVIVMQQMIAPPWDLVERLAGGDLRLLAGVITRADIEVPTRILGGLVVEDRGRSFVRRLLDRLVSLGKAPADFVPLITEIRGHCARRIDELESARALANLEDTLAFSERSNDWNEEYEAAETTIAERDQLVALLLQLDRLAVH